MSLLNIYQSQTLDESTAAPAASSPPQLAPVLMILDAVGAYLAFHFAAVLRLGTGLSLTSAPLYGTVSLVVIGLYLADTYRPERQTFTLETSARVLVANLLVGGLTSAIIYITGVWGDGKLYGRSIIVGGYVCLTIWSIAIRHLASRWVQSRAEQTRWMILAPPAEVPEFEEVLSKLYPSSEVVEVDWRSRLDDASDDGDFDLEPWKCQEWSGVLIGEPEELPRHLVRDLMEMRLRGVPTFSLRNFCERFLHRVPPSKLEDDWFVFSAGFSLVHKRIILRVKRVIDVVLSSLLLVSLSPLMLLVAILIKLDSKGPVLYRQTRTGLRGREFELYKFRSMEVDAEEDGAQWTDEDDPRVTRVGHWMRRLRIDELPQLWNVLRGDMSMIGPRPERPEFDSDLSERIPYYELRYLVKPGISGWAQVMHRYGASESDARTKLEYDLYYIKNYSLLLDLVIALRTLRVILFTRGR